LEEIVSGVQPCTRSDGKILRNLRQRLRQSGQRTISLWNPMVYSKYEEHFVTVDGIQKMPVARFIEVVYGQPADISRGKQGYRWKLTLIEGLLKPGNEPPPHVHGREDELFYILEGEMDV